MSNSKGIINKYNEAFSDNFGRYLVAAKALVPGECILRENPVIVGPAVFNKNLLCFNCLRIVSNISMNDKTLNNCQNCKIAVICSSTCQNRRAYHTLEECELFKSTISFEDFNLTKLRTIILPLRLWLLQRNDRELWNKVVKLEAHLEKRKNTAVWQERQENVVNVLKKAKIIGLDDDELIQKICGILDVNSFELRSPGTFDNSPLRGLYCQAALMAHDCRGNTHLTVDDDFNLNVYASVPIEKGQMILFNYTSSLLGTIERRMFLREGKYFDCNCTMCQDPEELGAHLSSIICPRCKKGFLRLNDSCIINAYLPERNWICGKCHKLYSGSLIKTTIDLAKCQINQTNYSTAKELEKLIKDLTRTFHPYNSIILGLKQKLLQIYRNDMTITVHPEINILQRILELCKEFIEVLEIVEPGISRLKGIILYEMHRPMVLIANRSYASRKIVSAELINRLRNAVKILKRSIQMLLLEPATTPEGILAKKALQEYQNLCINLKDVETLTK